MATQCRYCTPWPNQSNSELCILSKSWGFAPSSAVSRTRGMFVCWRNNARITQRGAWEMSNCVLWAIFVTVGPSDDHFGSVRNNLVASVRATSSLCPGSRVITSWNLWLNRYNYWKGLHLSVLSAPPRSEPQVILCPLRCKIRKARNTSTVYLTYLGPHPVSQALSHHLIWLGEIYSMSF